MIERDMPIYFAGRYSRRDELAGYAAEMRRAGFNVISHWLTETAESMEVLTDEERAATAERDCNEIQEADVFVLFTEPLNDMVPGPWATGGRHFETGYFKGLLDAGFGSAKVIVIGGPQNIFHYLPGVMHYPGWPAFKRVFLAALSEATDGD